MDIKSKILIVEDEQRISNFMSAVLNTNGYEIITALTGRAGLSMISSHCPDLVILDLGLPDMDGLDLIRDVREWSRLPILVVSARMHERDKIAALDAGADDYITKPFGTGELLARIRTAMRHTRGAAPAATEGVFTTGGLTVDYDRYRVTVDGENAKLTQNEFKIVSLLASHAGKVLTYDFILKSLWGPNAGGSNQVLRVHMANIRRKIEKNPAEPEYIFTEVGVGYRMAEPDGE